MSGYRFPSGGAIDRSKPVSFQFDGTGYSGFEGDTLASALLASGERLLGRSFKYHRPRGIVGLGTEEPNALVTLREGARSEPNVQATMAELFEGLVAKSQNAWPSLKRDAMAINGLLSPFLGAGFYYKTFMGPFKRSWMWYEPFIRKAAGLGRAADEADPDVYDKGNLFCDVLIVGGGPAGLAAAQAAAKAGVRVVLADDQPALGGALRGDGGAVGDWMAASIRDLDSMGVRLMPRTSVFGYYDGQTLGAVERLADHVAEPAQGQPRQKYWVIRTKQVILATGAIERPLVFPGNDRPGVMLAEAVRGFGARYGVAAGRRVAFFTNNDSAYGAARAFHMMGGNVAAIVDQRDGINDACRAVAEAIGCRHMPGTTITKVHGKHGVTGAGLGKTGASDVATTLDVDCIAMSGGWTPVVHLASQRGTPPVYAPDIGSFVPGQPAEGADWIAAGSINGTLTTDECLSQGAEAGLAAAKALGRTGAMPDLPATHDDLAGTKPAISPLPKGRGKAFVDFQNDVTASDVQKAHAEGYRSVEHLKRYTTLGMATDQGRTSNVNAIAIMAELSGRGPAETGTTRFRPPYTPVTLGALAGRHTGGHFAPLRRTPMQDWHAENGGLMSPVGPWMRPRAYLRGTESVRDAYIREAANVRKAVGICDVSTLGKIDVQGPDAAEFLNRVYSNPFLKVPVGKARYGLMLRDDGMVLDDGTSWRLSETQFLMTTTTGGAGTVMAHLERLLSVFWPDLRVSVTSTTSQWAGMSLAGPHARDTLAAALPGVDLSDAALPFMGLLQTRMQDTPVLIARLSFSGELAFEVFTGADHGLAVWKQLLAAGEPYGIMPYGTEALGTLRIEKGHIAGGEMDGRISPYNVGLAGMLSQKKDYFGSKMVHREGLHDKDRYEWVGLISTGRVPLRAGAHLVTGEATAPGPSQGWVSSTTYSPALDKEIALALVKNGADRIGSEMYAADPVNGKHPKVALVSAHFYDPDGSRMRG